jgi:ribosomal protein L24E
MLKSKNLMQIYKIGILFLAILSLSSCYLPVSFDTEIEISKHGLYNISFDGYIVDLNIYRGLSDKKLKEDTDEMKVKTDATIADFRRDKSTKSALYYKQGAFKVKWVKSGDIIKTSQVIFLRRNENIFSITRDKKKEIITLKGKYFKNKDIEGFERIGLTFRGVVRIKTNAKVITHNAQKVWNEGSIKFYGWRLKSMHDKPPLLIMSLG